MSAVNATFEWGKNPDTEDHEEFVFLIADVIESSELFFEDMPDDLLIENAQALNSVYDHVLDCLNLQRGSEWEWNWAGDGGVFAFRGSKTGTTQAVFECAIRIAELPPFTRSNGEKLQLQVRLVIHRGKAYFHDYNGLRRSAALNTASKMRIPGSRTSLTITDEVRRKLHHPRSSDFRAIDVGLTTVYGYVPLMRSALSAEIAAERDRDQAQAAHLSYRLGTLNLSVGDRDGAKAAFADAKRLISEIGPKHRYFWRTLSEFYEMWFLVAAGAKDVLLRQAEGHDWQKMMRCAVLWDAFTKDHPPVGRWQLLMQLEVIMEQLDVLASQPVDDPVGLTSLEVCLLLERVGYPRRWYGTAIFNRIERIKAEVKETYDKTVDTGCSICTGVAASCLILDGQHHADEMLKWLKSPAVKGARFCYRREDSFADAEPYQHAVQYAASVLQAFIDDGLAKNDKDIEAALDVFLGQVDLKSKHFPPEWVRWRNTTIYDFCSYVFPTFARYILAGDRSLSADETEFLSNMLGALANYTNDDGSAAFLHVNARGRIYGARENIGSFALGLLIGLSDAATALLNYNLSRFAYYAQRERSYAQRQRTIDSSIDRARKMIDGWLLQIECALFLRGNGVPIPQPAMQWLGIGANEETSSGK